MPLYHHHNLQRYKKGRNLETKILSLQTIYRLPVPAILSFYYELDASVLPSRL
jgi:hypothetical protein